MIGRITPRKLNADTDDRSLSADEMKKAINITVDSDSDGDGGVVKLSDGNMQILPSDPLSGVGDGINTVIGSVSDEELGVVLFCTQQPGEPRCLRIQLKNKYLQKDLL